MLKEQAEQTLISIERNSRNTAKKETVIDIRYGYTDLDVLYEKWLDEDARFIKPTRVY